MGLYGLTITGKVSVWFLGLVSIGFGGLFYGLGYVILRPMLLEAGVLHYIPPLGGATTVIGLLVVVVLTWFLFVRVFTFLGIDKM